MDGKVRALIDGLRRYYSAPLAQTFRKFRSGLIYFSVGLIVIYLAQSNLQPSLRQEIVTLCGIALLACGFFIAMMAHIRMIISRIVRFFLQK